jgi:cell wall-associated NlpC family hydrolase
VVDRGSRAWRLGALGRRTTVGAAVVFSVMSAACAATGAVPRPFPTPGPTNTPPSAPDHDAVVETALALRGTPYRDGGDGPGGFDCSGFTQYVFAQHGVSIPRGVREQFATGRHIKRDELEAGDLIFFTTTVRGASHVGIAVGGDEFVHAPSSAGVVRFEHLSSSYWSARFVGARRVGVE